ncbi:MAG TPA: hypothetical protein VHR36_06375 [Pyrinomonadaceae bacterium]|nr:hypothetical protein [Pyrinomonadaceae bacterium]
MSDKVWFVEQGEFDQLKFVAYQPIHMILPANGTINSSLSDKAN